MSRDEYSVVITYPHWNGASERLRRNTLDEATRVADWHRTKGGQATVEQRQVIVTDWRPVADSGDPWPELPNPKEQK